MSTGRVRRRLLARSVAEGGGRVLRLVALMVAARLLPGTELGIYVYAASLGFVFAEATDLGLHLYGGRELSGGAQAASELGWSLLGSKLLLCVVPVAVLSTVAGLSGERGLPILFAGLGLCLMSFQDAVAHLLRALGRVELDVAVSLSTALAASGLMLGGLLWSRTAVGLALGTLFGGVATVLIVACFWWSAVGAPRFFDARMRPRALLSALAPVALGFAASRVFFHVEVIVGGFLLAETVVAQAGVALRLAGNAMLPAAVVSAALFPVIAADIKLAPDCVQRRLVRTGGALVGAGAVAGAGCVIFAEPLLALLFGSAYGAAAPYLAMLALSFLWMFPEYILGPALIALDARRAYGLLWAGCTTLLGIAAWITMPRAGLMGALAMRCVLSFAMVVGQVLVARRALARLEAT